jgi:ribosome-interacting GTPase 1
MPTNVSPEFKKAEEAYRAAKTPEERLACLEEMLSTIPKHKGTEKMQADIKTRMARLRREITGGRKGGAKRQDWLHVD